MVHPGTLKYVINTLLQRPDLSLLYLNFSGHNVKTNQVQGDLWLDPEIAAGELSGKSIFQHSIEKDLGSVIFISAIVFQTQSAQTATQRWSQMLDNWACVATWAGFCATQGNVMITLESHLECIIGVSHWQKLPRMHFKTRYQDTPEVFLSLSRSQTHVGTGK